ncbi:MAG: hypothetical protein HYS17_10955 [Micavibrio aeruginosavorus]|uniref:Uncharacterized protein n=1 Tax=Micavibrio aeruginosavorus TaxID=349221 RepID=A0A7T5UHU9_9BACT|nr:MAG: hypothetical protein HYS17_10955 [Micavibrio aeruginosavorus]
MTRDSRSLHSQWSQASAAAKNPRLRQIIQTLEERGTEGLGVTDICKLIQFTKREILARARADKKLLTNQGHYITGFSDDSYRREIDALKILAEGLHFTPALHQWVDSCLTGLAQRLAREHTAAQMRDIWKGMDENGHLSYMKAVNILHAQAFSQRELPIAPADIQVKSLPDRILGTFCFDGHELYAASQPIIHLDPSNIHKSTLEKAVGTVVHEGLHNVLRQLARHHHANPLSSAHPLRKDAALMLARVQYDAYIPSIFGEAYLADAEERLCFKHEQFAPLFSAQTGKLPHWAERIRRLFPD